MAFTQCFLLAPLQPQGYFVQNDVFRLCTF
jgi:hypothetical protein